MSGLFLVFEGIEGSGKSTQARRLAGRLEGSGVPHRLAREPGGSEGGERAREIVLDPTVELCDEAELLLYLSARAQFVREVVEPALEREEVVVADRYELSTFAYQGIARGLGLERVRELNRFATGGREPDLTIFVDVDPEEGRRRREGTALDRLEREGGPFHERVAEAYRRFAREDPAIVRVSGDGSPEEVAGRVLRAIEGRFPRLLADGPGG